MKTTVPLTKFFNQLMLIVFVLALCVSVKGQTYTSIKNGAWNNASTWQGGIIPPVDGNILAGMVINVKHRVSYSGININNSGTINITNPGGPSPRLSVASGITITNNTGGIFTINNGEYKQSRFVGGLQVGIPQTGSFINAGGLLDVRNSFMEVAENLVNQNMGIRFIHNTSIATGKDFKLSSNSFDTLRYSSFSVGLHGSGDFSTTGGSVLFQSVRIQVASPAGVFKINGSYANGDIDIITLKNHVTNLVGTGTITVSNSVVTSGLNLDAYCASSPAMYFPNGKVSGTQTASCSQNYFPAKLFASPSSSSMNMTETPVLVSGTNLQAGAKYQYESIVPGIDAFVTIDSLVNGATINNLDDNANGSGFTEGFQPQITSGAVIGESYVKLKFEYFISGTDVYATISDITLTALDIDGTATYKEFDEINLGPGATAAYVLGTPGISLTEVSPGAFRGINADGKTVNGVDTTAKQYMFSVNNKDISSFTVKMGLVNTQAVATYRLFSFYSKAFVYPAMGTLPVKMESFTATLNNSGNKVDLKWTTASEKNVSHFIVEKSTDGSTFSDAGLVFASGTETTRTSYTFADNVSSYQSKVIYYRIRTIDNDSKTQLSETRLIRLGSKSENAVTIIAYPNPVSSDLRITIPANWQNKKTVYEIISANGQVAKKVETGSSSQTENINVSSLAPGFYLIKVSCDNQSVQQRIVKQ